MDKDDNDMMALQTVQSPTPHRRSSSVKYEQSTQPPYWRWHRPAKRDMRDLLKKVQTTYMNRVFHGIGFHNDNGGLEFFSESYKELRMGDTISYINALRVSAASTEHEILSLRKLIERQEEEADQWAEIHGELQAHLKDITSSIENLIEQGKQGLVTMEDSERQRLLFRKERSKVSRQLDEVKAKIGSYSKNKYRLSFLDGILSEVFGELEFKERDLSVTNTFTIGKPGVLTVPFIKGISNKKCCLFMNMFDFQAYDFLSNYDYAPTLPRLCDNIILNDCRNFMNLLMNIDVYDHIYCFFPNTLAGKFISSSIKERKKECVMDISDYFDGYDSMYSYALTFEEFVPITTKI